MTVLNIELLPDLTIAQKDFALEYYPIFDRLKRAILMVAGSMLLATHHSIREVVYLAILRNALQEINLASDEWVRWKPRREMINEYALISDAISDLCDLVDHLCRETDVQRGFLVSDIVDGLSNTNVKLRRLALRFWRLELVAETHSH